MISVPRWGSPMTDLYNIVYWTAECQRLMELKEKLEKDMEDVERLKKFLEAGAITLEDFVLKAMDHEETQEWVVAEMESLIAGLNCRRRDL